MDTWIIVAIAASSDPGLTYISRASDNPALSNEEKSTFKIFDFILDLLKYDRKYMDAESSKNLTEHDYQSILWYPRCDWSSGTANSA
ncbi:hypothetical protein VTP01DRAFT_8057 [Rhizomucor pusillus]|uniref:uncharacterized protein n=1 Tax=Rhizomucor pusillus TaxID=4840 RepID=UPI003743554F